MDQFEALFCWQLFCYFVFGYYRSTYFIVFLVIIYMVYYKEKVLSEGRGAARPVHDALDKYLDCEIERARLVVQVVRKVIEDLLL